MDLRPEEISAILRKQLSEFEQSAQVSEVGTVLSVGDGIARASGLSNVMAAELVQFDSGPIGMVLT
ncbi:MAG: F0F1 ATP synthase subunit alpha, partial [bacterium]